MHVGQNEGRKLHILAEENLDETGHPLKDVEGNL
jgi:hypothetical protein